jgi:uncharacterized protein YwgA
MRKLIISTLAVASILGAAIAPAMAFPVYHFHGDYGPYSEEVAIQQAHQWEHDHGLTSARGETGDYYSAEVTKCPWTDHAHTTSGHRHCVRVWHWY